MTNPDKSGKDGRNNDSSGIARNNRYQRRLMDDYQAGIDWKRGAIPVSDLLPKLVDPLFADKGLSSSALVAAWPDIVGHTFSDCTMIETIRWPYRHNNGTSSYRGGILVVRVDGPKAIYLQHEEQQILQRANRFFGFAALERLKIIQAPIERRHKPIKDLPPELSYDQEQKLRECIAEFEDPALNEAIIKMGREVLKKALRKKS